MKVQDFAGNTFTYSQSVRLDRTGPTVTTSPVSASYDSSGSFVFTFGATDIDMVSSLTAKLDSTTTLTSGGSINLNTLTAGTHTITVTAVDGVGNVTTVTLTFQVHATVSGLISDVNYGTANGLIQSPVAPSLLSPLNAAQSALAAGNNAAAKSYLNTFISQVQLAGNKISSSYASLLIGLAQDLIARL